MKRFKMLSGVVAFILFVAFQALAASAWESLPHPETYVPTAGELKEIMKPLDDGNDRIITAPLDKVLPPEIYELLLCDLEEAKRQWAEIVGLDVRNLVGNIAPEIKPGKYTYKDLEQHPGLKELLPPEFVQSIKPGGPRYPATSQSLRSSPPGNCTGIHGIVRQPKRIYRYGVQI